jgi:hypothetical protein
MKRNVKLLEGTWSVVNLVVLVLLIFSLAGVHGAIRANELDEIAVGLVLSLGGFGVCLLASRRRARWLVGSFDSCVISIFCLLPLAAHESDLNSTSYLLLLAIVFPFGLRLYLNVRYGQVIFREMETGEQGRSCA